MFAFALLFAVHLPDGVLSPPWLLGGALLAGFLCFLGSWRICDEEIPRVALLTAAFFVAALLHLPLGLGNVHLLLAGLMGVVLGWRAALAIPIGLGLQAVVGHGGFLVLGVNSCVMAIPALLAGAAWTLLRPCLRGRSPRVRAELEFGLGVLLGAGGVLATTALYALVLVFACHRELQVAAAVVVVAHLPLAAAEGIVLGFILRFLAQVKPELIGLDSAPPVVAETPSVVPASPTALNPQKAVTLILIAGALLLGQATPAYAHRLKHKYAIAREQHRVQVDAWFATGGTPKQSCVVVFAPGKNEIARVPINDQGVAEFYYNQPTDLHVVLDVPDHPAAFDISRHELEGTAETTPAPLAKHEADDVRRDVLLGVAFVLALAAFVMSVLNARKLKLSETRTPADDAPGSPNVTASPGLLLPATPPTEAFRR